MGDTSPVAAGDDVGDVCTFGISVLLLCGLGPLL